MDIKKTYLYKHMSSIGNYLGDISDDEPAVIYQIFVNPQTGILSMTGLYAPPGELIKIQIKEEDLQKIGSFTVMIGPSRPNGIIVNNLIAISGISISKNGAVEVDNCSNSSLVV